MESAACKEREVGHRDQMYMYSWHGDLPKESVIGAGPGSGAPTLQTVLFQLTP